MELLDSLSSNQKEILSSFQAVTSTDDIENAINILNSSDWNLEVSLHSQFPIKIKLNYVKNNKHDDDDIDKFLSLSYLNFDLD